MKLRPSSYLIALVLLVMLIAGCGGSGSGPNPPNPPVISVAFSPAAPTSINTGAKASLTADVSNDTANGGVSWSVACGSSACGSFSATSTPSGTATTYTAPAAAPSPATVTVTATSVTDATKSASASITVGPPPVVLMDGNYVFHLAGQDGAGNYYVAGAFTVKNQVIAGGEQDMTDDTDPGYYHDSLTASGSNLSLVNGNIQIVLNTGDPNVGVNGVETLRGAIVSNARALISEFDAFATATGSLDQQTSVASPAGGYAFNLGGLDTNDNTFVAGGILNISGANLSVGSSVLDYNDGGSPAQAQTFDSGTVGAPDAYGRVAFALIPSASSGLPAFNFAGYTVSPSQLQLVETQDALNGVTGGTALGQGSNTGKFSQASVAGSSYAFEAIGQDVYSQNSTIAQMAGGFGLNADNTVSGAMALNDLTLHLGAQITSGTYTIDPTGRVTLTCGCNVRFLPESSSFHLPALPGWQWECAGTRRRSYSGNVRSRLFANGTLGRFRRYLCAQCVRHRCHREWSGLVWCGSCNCGLGFLHRIYGLQRTGCEQRNVWRDFKCTAHGLGRQLNRPPPVAGADRRGRTECTGSASECRLRLLPHRRHSSDRD